MEKTKQIVLNRIKEIKENIEKTMQEVKEAENKYHWSDNSEQAKNERENIKIVKGIINTRFAILNEITSYVAQEATIDWRTKKVKIWDTNEVQHDELL